MSRFRLPLLFVALSSLAACAQAQPPDDDYDIYAPTAATGVPAQLLFYKGNFLPAGEEATVDDYCYNADAVGVALPRGNRLKEYLVTDGVLSFGDRDCACENGACARPAPVTACSDTDGGRNIYVRGQVVGINAAGGDNFQSLSEDRCGLGYEIVNFDENGKTIPTGKRMPPTMLLETSCAEAGSLEYREEWVSCPYGCDKGACKQGASN